MTPTDSMSIFITAYNQLGLYNNLKKKSTLINKYQTMEARLAEI
jgi:hypothetical protein